jgi:hypothetical protein
MKDYESLVTIDPRYMRRGWVEIFRDWSGVCQVVRRGKR